MKAFQIESDPSPLSDRLIKNYLSRIIENLGISYRVELVLNAVANPKGNTLTSSESEEENPFDYGLRRNVTCAIRSCKLFQSRNCRNGVTIFNT